MSTDLDPRIERTRTVVMQSAIDIVAERGFAGASIDAIAQRSGVARSTIYRHWSRKEDLLLEAMGVAVGDVASLTVGDLRNDLIAITTRLAEMLGTEPMGSVVAAIILESRREPDLDALRRSVIGQRQIAAQRVIGDAIDRGDLGPGVDVDALAVDLAAPILFRALVLRAPIDSSWIEAHVDRSIRLHAP